jgi:hypothetical protein
MFTTMITQMMNLFARKEAVVVAEETFQLRYDKVSWGQYQTRSN